jgi:hypothetical protein
MYSLVYEMKEGTTVQWYVIRSVPGKVENFLGAKDVQIVCQLSRITAAIGSGALVTWFVNDSNSA